MRARALQTEFIKQNKSAMTKFLNSMKAQSLPENRFDEAKAKARLDGGDTGDFDAYLAELWLKWMVAHPRAAEVTPLMSLLSDVPRFTDPMPRDSNAPLAEKALETALIAEVDKQNNRAGFGDGVDDLLQLKLCRLADEAGHVVIQFPMLQTFVASSKELLDGRKPLGHDQQATSYHRALPSTFSFDPQPLPLTHHRLTSTRTSSFGHSHGSWQSP